MLLKVRRGYDVKLDQVRVLCLGGPRAGWRFVDIGRGRVQHPGDLETCRTCTALQRPLRAPMQSGWPPQGVLLDMRSMSELEHGNERHGSMHEWYSYLVSSCTSEQN